MSKNISLELRILKNMYVFRRCFAFTVNTAERHPAFGYDYTEASAVKQLGAHTAYAHLSSDFGNLISPRH